MAKMTGFKVYKGTKQAFIDSGKAAANADAIVFITGGNDAKGSCIYAQGVYFANFTEFLAAINYVKGVNVGGTSYNAAQGGGYIAFGSKDPATVSVNAGENGIEVGLSDAFVKKVNDTATALGSASDAAKVDGSAFARIANLAAIVSDLTGGSTESVASQITKAIGDLRTEIVGTLDATDAKTLQAINDELNAIDAKWANYVTTDALSKIEGSDDAGSLVKVSVASKGGKVTEVTVDEEALNSALAAKANDSDVYKKTETYTKTEADALIGAVGTRVTNEAPVSMETVAGSGDVLKTYVFKQNSKEIGRIELAKDIVVKEGILAVHDGVKCIDLTLNNEAGTIIHIPVNDLVDVYTGSEYVSVSDKNVISVDKAGIIAGLATDANAQKYATDAEGRITETLKAYETAATAAGKYVAKESGKRLMTDAEGTKLAAIAAGAQVNVIENIKVNGVTGTVVNKVAEVTVDCYTKQEVNNAIKDFAPKATTLAGYGITDAYTKSQTYTQAEVDAMWEWEEL